jgi:hypothetical protein
MFEPEIILAHRTNSCNCKLLYRILFQFSSDSLSNLSKKASNRSAAPVESSEGSNAGKSYLLVEPFLVALEGLTWVADLANFMLVTLLVSFGAFFGSFAFLGCVAAFLDVVAFLGGVAFLDGVAFLGGVAFFGDFSFFGFAALLGFLALLGFS